MDGNGRWADGARACRGSPDIAPERTRCGAPSKPRRAGNFDSDAVRVFRRQLAASGARSFRADEASGPLSDQERDRCIANGVRLQAIGRRDRLPAPLVALLEETERTTARGRKLHLRLAIDYSSRQAILERRGKRREADVRAAVCERLGPDVDLLIRTSGEQRLSDFLLWECAYAEMVFTRRMWPDFSAPDLARRSKSFTAASGDSERSRHRLRRFRDRSLDRLS